MMDWFTVGSVLSFLFTLAVAAGGFAIAVWASRKANVQSEHIARLVHPSQTKTSSASTTAPPRKLSQQ
ncbi:exported protein of unknown function [Candidatus Filomicrobium marinum]|uniref:Uncharacterized protein n=2 Tax=Filomicrobium TaxID=119044 RepID=A0A0D6JDC4_9HYPH|nr:MULTISPECIES: hypothetical protein [Filomicrobium]MCV0368131.1 hypothetical protein [Filomicrobium sp.]CFX14336.1 exported protein of unknown function [Candidatus Filomicrobium marinum]CPR17772.1 exported protein of unknown function [Candidatus Filomicrobium marinum]SDO28291.1 hypothetical protein SAMN04488061_0788 [Filomicrobium insigne]